MVCVFVVRVCLGGREDGVGAFAFAEEEVFSVEEVGGCGGAGGVGDALVV